MILGALGGAGCSSPLCGGHSSLTGGSYALDPATEERKLYSWQIWQAANYRLTLSADRTTVVEEFDLSGKHYRFVYAITAIDRRTAG
jgi:hypothetical protein